MNPHIKSNAIKYGVIIAAIGIIYTLIGYLIDFELLVTWWVGILLFIINLVLLLVAVRKTREDMGGFMEFKEAFSAFIVTYIVASVISVAFNILLFGLIDPEAGDELHELVISTTVESMQNFGAPQQAIEDQIENMEASNQFSIGSQLKGFLWGIVIYSVIGLIVAAVMKKTPPAEYYDESEEV